MYDIIKGERAYFLKEHLKYIVLFPIFFWVWIIATGNSSEDYKIYTYSISVFNIGILISLFSIYAFISSYFFKPFKQAKLWNETGLKTVNFIASDISIKIDAPSYEYSCKWCDIEKHWFTKDFLIFTTKHKSYSSIPIGKFNDELQSFIRLKLNALEKEM